jgi:charged multivesicular body protein 7
MNKIILAIALFATAVYAAPEWDGLRVTWDFNPLNLWAFNGMPRSLGELKSDFQLRDDQCKTPNAKFLGQRYWYKEDPAITLLYDTKGTIAGIQTSIPKANYTPTATPAGRNYVDDGNYWTLTAYFVDPSTICADGRSQDQLKSEGTGSNLYLQHGPNPIQDSVAIPRSEEEAKKTLWGHGKCFYTMGQHYWYNVSKDMNCNDFVPNCLMYNKGRLTAFCFAANVVLPSRRYEHPTNQQAKMFLDPVPDCYYKDPSYKKTSTIHVYMIDAPRTRSLC